LSWDVGGRDGQALRNVGIQQAPAAGSSVRVVEMLVAEIEVLIGDNDGQG
jgi:hypothetical protein